MAHSRKSVSGVITVMVSLMMVGILSLGTLTLEAGRLAVARTQLQAATGSAANSMIAAFDSELYDRYGVLAIDTARFNEGRFQEYVYFNSDMGSGHTGNNISVLYTIDSVKLDGIYSLAYPSVLKRQILTRAKYHTEPNQFGLNLYNMDYFLSDLQMKSDYVTRKMNEILDRPEVAGADTRSADMKLAMELMYEVLVRESESTEYTSVVLEDAFDVILSDATIARLPSKNPVDQTEGGILNNDINRINATHGDVIAEVGVDLKMLQNSMIYDDPDVHISQLAEQDAIADYLIEPAVHGKLGDYRKAANSVKMASQGISGAIQALRADDEGNLLLNTYIAAYFSNKNYQVTSYTGPETADLFNGNRDDATFVAACAEYVLGGSASEMENQELAYRYMFGIRLVNNLYSVFTESDCNVSDPWSVTSHISWGYFETAVDMRLLSEYNAVVPFTKNQQILDIRNPGSVAAAFGQKELLGAMNALGFYENGQFVIEGFSPFNYTDMLSLALWFVPNSQKLMRVADLMQLEMRYRQAYVDEVGATFLISNQDTYCRAYVSAKMNAILPVISLNGGSLQGLEIECIKYAGY